MSVLVTGGAGYIGSHVVLGLKDSGIPCVVIDNLSTGNRSLVPSDIPFFEADVTDISVLKQIFYDFNIDTVIHLAGSLIVPESIMYPLDYYHNNTCRSLTLIKACVEHGIKKFIFSSTAAVYGVPQVIPTAETEPTNPINPYGWSKLMVERILVDTAKAYDFNFVALRYFNVAGADPQKRTGQHTRNSTHLIKIVSELALQQRANMEIFGEDYATPDGSCIRDFIHVSDLAAAHVSAFNYLNQHGKSVILNCGYGHGYSVKEIINEAEKIINTKLNVKVSKRREGDIPHIVAATEKIKKLLDWQPKYDDINYIIQTSINWLDK